MQSTYKFHKKIILRNPYLAFNPNNISKEKIQEVLHEKWFQEALYLASPDLHRMSMDWIGGATIEPRKQEKLIASLTKYYSRMMSRCTPYGLFATCSIAEWDTETNIVLEEHDIIRHTRLDMYFSCALAFELIKKDIIKHNILYFPNSSIYQIGNEIRFVEYQYIDGRRIHQISAVTQTKYLQNIIDLAQGGATYQALVGSIIDTDISVEDIESFIDELIHSQVLVHELEPAITGGDFTKQIIKVLDKVFQKTNDNSIGEYLTILHEIDTLLKKLDTQKINNIADYHVIIHKIKLLGISFEENKLFQTDSFRKPNDLKMAFKLQESLEKAMTLLNRLYIKKGNKNLAFFMKRFSERYENNEVSLLEALDTETGIGYLENNTNAGAAPLIDNLQLPKIQEDTTTSWTKIEKWFFEKLKIATEKQQYSIEITDEELKKFPEANWDDLPPSLSMIFRLIDDKCIYIESVGGSSTINLLGRFAYGDNTISETAQDIAQTEQSLNDEVIFAEIIHLPESRTGNILLHPAFRSYEIPFLAKSSLPIENQITLQDLYIFIHENTIFLRSKKLNKIIIPRLSNAHNYSNNTLPIYQFLCDLQHQHKRTNFTFNWGSVSKEFKFLPQISYKNIILEAATWNLNKQEIEDLIAQPEKYSMTNTLKVLVDGDNELLIDFSNPHSIDSLKDAIKTKEHIKLKEFIYDPTTSLTRNTQNQGFTNQFIALLIREKQAYQGINVYHPSQSIQRSFSIGSEWLYFKLYGGVKVADKVLIEYIKPFIEILFKKDLIDYWFFIRYSDPENHLRIRLHLKSTSKYGTVIRLFHKTIKPAEQAKYIWKIQTDTYQRELERYGFDNILLAEKLFFYDSESVMSFLEMTEGDTREHIRWLWGIKIIDKFLGHFKLGLLQKKELLQKMKDSFAQEFNMDLPLKKQLDKKYRDNRLAIEYILNDKNNLNDLISNMTEILHKNDTNMADGAQQILDSYKKTVYTFGIEHLLSSFIHMSLNRLIPVNQRLHELVSYDFLFRYYESQLGRQKVVSEQTCLV